ncbi:MAG: glycosyltransferase, partial [Methanosarcinaceae archaeon]|nr:glycosyltransferase [Methanosarcinaceae archaeon]
LYIHSLYFTTITCLSKSKGELIKPLYDDDLLEPRCVERMVEYINKHPSATLVTSHRQLIDSEGRKLRDTNATKRIVQKDALINGSTIVRALVTNRINFIGEPSTVMFRKEDLIDEYPDILSFAGRKPVMNGDVAIWMKLLSRGDCIYIAESLSSFRQHKEQKQRHPELREKGSLAWEHALFDAKRMGFLSPSVPQLSDQPLSVKSLGAKKNFSVSIIIPVFNQLEYTKQCLETLYKNTSVKNDFEVIVVDNASTDSTPEFLKEALKRYHRLRVLTNYENLGFSRSCNQGARAAESICILFLNNDTEVQPGWIEPLLQVLNNDPTVAAVGSKMLFPDNTIQHAGVVVLDDKKLPDPLVARHIYYGQKDDFPKANQPCTYQVLTAACLLVRKYAFEEVGGFDEEYWNGYEDVDLCFKLQKRGWLLIYQPKSIVTHYESQSGPERFRATQHNIERLHQKWLGKIVPDLVVEANGSVQETNAGRIRPYILPNQLYRQPEASIRDYDPLTSIIILTHNQIKYTKKCIESIFKFTNRNYELILVDNGSTDGTVQYLEKLRSTYRAGGSKENRGATKQKGKKKKAKRIKQLNNTCKAVRLIKNDENLGFAAGNNQGITEAQGDYILF